MKQFLDLARRAVEALERIAAILVKVYDVDEQAIKLYDVKRAEVYKAALAPEVKEKFGIKP